MRTPAFPPAAVLAILTVLAGCWATTGAAGAQIDGSVTVTVEPRSASAVLGEHLDLAIEVTNNGSEPTPPLVIHLDITDPDNADSVDPEDWTSTLTKPLVVLEAGQTRTVDWRIQPISSGSFATYAVALAPGWPNWQARTWSPSTLPIAAASIRTGSCLSPSPSPR